MKRIVLIVSGVAVLVAGVALVIKRKLQTAR